MNTFVCSTYFWRLVKTKNGKTLLKIFDDNLFAITVFVLDGDMLAKLGDLVQGYEYVFTYIRNYNSGFGNLLRLTYCTKDNEDVTLYTF